VPASVRLDSAKTSFFDRKYAEARQAWQAVLAAGGGDSEAAAYWIARCSENLGELDRAFREYGEYLDRLPAERALGDTSKTVRYYAAFQLTGLGE
jgi:hypothetical protein